MVSDSLNELTARNYLPKNIQWDGKEFWVSKADYDLVVAILRQHPAEEDGYVKLRTQKFTTTGKYTPTPTHVCTEVEIVSKAEEAIFDNASEIRYDMAEEIAALKALHKEIPHVLDYRTKDGFTIPTLNVLMALIGQRSPEPVSLKDMHAAIAKASDERGHYDERTGIIAVLDAAGVKYVD